MTGPRRRPRARPRTVTDPGLPDADPAVEAAHVALARRQQMGRQAPCLVQQGHRGPEHGRAAHLEGPRPHRPPPRGTSSVSECRTVTAPNGTPEGVGHDLRPRGLVPLPVGAGPGQDGERPLLVGLHRRRTRSPSP